MQGAVAVVVAPEAPVVKVVAVPAAAVQVLMEFLAQQTPAVVVVAIGLKQVMPETVVLES
jgi:hypothetical protein